LGTGNVYLINEAQKTVYISRPKSCNGISLFIKY
jgi:hypothetical protein